MHGYDFPMDPAAPLLPGIQRGRWWAWDPADSLLDSRPGLIEHRIDYLANELTDTAKETPPPAAPQRQLVPVLDLEGFADADKEKIALNCLSLLQQRMPTACLIIQFWVGIPPTWLYEKIVKVLNGPYSNNLRAIRDLAVRHRPLVKRARMVTQHAVFDLRQPDHIGLVCAKVKAVGRFMREAYPGTEICAWTCGSYQKEPRTPAPPSYTEEDCVLLADAISGYDSFALYASELPENRLFTDVLTRRFLG